MERWQLEVVLPPNPLDAALTGQGSVQVGPESLDCPGCNVGVRKGDPVVLEAVPAPGSAFHSWKTVPEELCANPLDSTCSFTPTAGARLEAYFVTRATNLWALGPGGAGYDEAVDVAVDPDGNVFVAGCFSESVVFGSRTLNSHGACDAYVAKVDPQGKVLFSNSLGGVEDDNATSIAVLSDGVAVGGTFYGAARDIVLPDESVITTDADGGDAFIAFFDLDLAYRGIWHLHGDGSKSVTSLTAAASGEVFALGSVGVTLDLGETELTAGRYIAKLTSSAALLWAKPLPALSIESDSVWTGGKLVVGGNFNTSISLGGSCPVLTATTVAQGYVALLDDGGVCEKAHTVGGQNEIAGVASVAADRDGNVIVGGAFRAAIHLDPADPNSILQSQAIYPSFVAKLGPDLGWRAGVSFARAFDAGHTVTALAVDDDDGIMVGVNVRGAWPGIPSYFTDIVLTKLDPSGELVFLRQFGSPTSEVLASLAWDPRTRGWVLGGHHGDGLSEAPIDFGGIGTNPLSFVVHDALVAKFSP